jgi:hypothetical protein
MTHDKTSNEMPFGVAVLFAAVGIGVFLAVFLAWVAPALWVYLAYRPATATLLETRPTQKHRKGGEYHWLEARLGITVGGQTYERWVALPRGAGHREGPLAESVRDQAALRQQLPCFYDPFAPGTSLVLERNRLEWGMLFGLLFPLVFLAVGCAGMVAGWRRTFPRGVRVWAGEILTRLSWRFYLALLSAVLALSAGWLTIELVGPRLGGLGVLVILGTIGAVVLTIRLALRYGSVAFPSPERGAARGRAAGHPTGDEAPIDPPPGRWLPEVNIAVEPGAWLSVRLPAEKFSNYPGGAALLSFWSIMLAGMVLLALALRLTGQFGARHRVAPLLIILLAVVVGIWSWTWIARRVRELTVELSDHPLRPGGRHQIVVAHVDPAELSRLRLDLVCEEASEQTDRRGGRAASRSTVFRRSLELESDSDRDRETEPELELELDPPAPAPRIDVRFARLDVPASAPFSVALEHHWINWLITVRLGGWFPWTVRFPLVMKGPRPQDIPLSPAMRPPQEGDETSRLDREPIALWITDGRAPFRPGALLAGGHAVEPQENRRLQTVELSILWHTAGAGATDLGICHYEDFAAADGDDLSLYSPGSFSARLPDGPPSYEGKSFQIRWMLRLRLRYADGTEIVGELPFRLGSPDVATGSSDH